jgi:hypothetical protein
MKKCCTILLQRNLPEVTNRIGEEILSNNSDLTDFYVVESGSDDDRLSKFTKNTFHANWDDARKNGLRTGRGFNFGLTELEKLGKKYDYYFLVTGDTIFEQKNCVEIMLSEMENNPKMGILSPLSRKWGNEFSHLWDKNKTQSVTLIPHVAWMFKHKLIETISKDFESKDFMGYLYDGTNFRCYDADTEILVKSYTYDFFPAITSKVYIKEDEFLTDRNFKVMKTEDRETHKKLMWDEGMAWLKRKYNFDGKQQMRQLLYNSRYHFFKRNPDVGNMI